MKPETLAKLEEVQRKLHSNGWGHEGPSPEHLRDVLDKLIEALLEDTEQD